MTQNGTVGHFSESRPNGRMIKSSRLRRWLPLLVIGAVCVLAFVTRPLWLTCLAAYRHPIHIRCGGIGFDLHGQWAATDIAETEYSFLRVASVDGANWKSTPTVLVVGKYRDRNVEVEEQARRSDNASVKVSIKLGEITYDLAQPVALAGNRGVKLFGSDKERDYLRIDLPSERVAITFIILEGGVGTNGADKIAADAVPGLNLELVSKPDPRR